ncbi:MAG: hypothetical protein AAF744_16485 [Pseudomonadota bacterium]
MSRRRDPLATHNERVRLFSGFINAVGLGFIGFAILRPLVELEAAIDGLFVFWALIGLALHGWAHYVLRYLEKGDQDDEL